MSILNRGHARHGVVMPKITPVTGRYYGYRTLLPGTSGATAISANQLYAAMFVLPVTTVVDRISINVTSAGAGSTTARLGLYAATTAGLPGALIVDGGAVAVDGTGLKTATIAATLVGGILYYAALVSDGTPTLATTAASWAPFGNSDASDVTRASLNRGFTYAALPDPWGTIAGYGTSVMNIVVRAA